MTTEGNRGGRARESSLSNEARYRDTINAAGEKDLNGKTKWRERNDTERMR